MKLLGLVLVGASLYPYTSNALEGTAKPVIDPTRELAQMQMVPVCPPGAPVAVSGTRFVCGQTASVQHGDSGFIELGGGVLMQWVRGTVPFRGATHGENGYFNINFPRAFSQVYNVQVSTLSATADASENTMWQVVSFNNTQVRLYAQNFHAVATGPLYPMVLAIGRI